MCILFLLVSLSCLTILNFLLKINLSVHVSNVGLRGLNYCQGDTQLFVRYTTFKVFLFLDPSHFSLLPTNNLFSSMYFKMVIHLWFHLLQPLKLILVTLFHLLYFWDMKKLDKLLSFSFWNNLKMLNQLWELHYRQSLQFSFCLIIVWRLEL